MKEEWSKNRILWCSQKDFILRNKNFLDFCSLISVFQIVNGFSFMKLLSNHSTARFAPCSNLLTKDSKLKSQV